MSIDPNAALRLSQDATFQLAQGDPLACARIVAKAIQRQPSGAKRLLVLTLARAIAEDEPNFIAGLVTDLAGHVREHH
jgi:hypothetical protein